MRGWNLAVVALALPLLFAACDPFGLPATRQIENAVATMLSSSASYEMKGSYSAGSTAWKIDLLLAPQGSRHISASSGGQTVEAIIVAGDGYFRGQQFLAAHLAGNPLAPALVKAAGNSWWKDAAGLVPALPDFTDGATFKSTFLGTAATRRTDHQTAGGVDAVELSGDRADVFIASAPPNRLLRVQLKSGVTIDGVHDATFDYGSFGADFHIAAPPDVIDFSNFSTLPPIYTVVSVDTSGCGSPCVVAAKLRNLGGMSSAKAPSTVTFAMTDPASKQSLGTCSAVVQPDVGYNATTVVSCTLDGAPRNAALVTASADNPGRA